MKRSLKISYHDRLLFCFIAGVIGGTVTANLLSGELQSQIGYFNTLFLSGQSLGGREQQELWYFVVKQRLLEVSGAWLVGLTVFSALGYYILAVLAGGSVALVLSVITVQKGMMGLPFYLATIVPQVFCYLPVCLVLAVWAGEDSRNIHLAGMGILVGLTVAGAVLEVYLNPLVLGFL